MSEAPAQCCIKVKPRPSVRPCVCPAPVSAAPQGSGRCVSLRVIWVKITVSSFLFFSSLCEGRSRGGGVGVPPRLRGAQSPAVAVRSAELPALATAWGGRGRRTRGTRPPSVVSAVRLPRGDTHSKSRRGRDFTAWLLAAGALQEPRSPAGPGLAARGGGCPAVPRQQLRRKFLAVRGMQPLLLPPTLGCVACVLFCAPPLPPLGNIHIIIISIFFSVAAFTGIACPTAGRGVRTMQSGPSLPGFPGMHFSVAWPVKERVAP